MLVILFTILALICSEIIASATEEQYTTSSENLGATLTTWILEDYNDWNLPFAKSIYIK